MEFWGDEIADLRHFELSSQRSTRDGRSRRRAAGRRAGEGGSRAGRAAVGLGALSAGHAVRLSRRLAPAAGAQAHVGRSGASSRSRAPARRGRRLARRAVRGARTRAARRSHAFGSLRLVDPAAEDSRRRLPASRAGADRPRHQAAARARARRTADGHPLRQRRAVRASRRAAQRGRARSVARGARRRRARRRLRRSAAGDHERGLRVLTDHEIFRRERRVRRARRYVSGGGRLARRSSSATTSCISSTASASTAASRRSSSAQSTVEVAVVEYEGGDRLNVPLYRIDQLERYRAADDVSDDAPPPRLHKLGGKRWAQQRDRTRAAIQEMTLELLDLYARRKVAVASRRTCPTPRGSASSRAASSSRTRPISARRRPT